MAEKDRKYKRGICAYCGNTIPIRSGRLYAWCSETHRSYFYTEGKIDRLNSKYTMESFAMSILRGMADE